MSAVRPVIMRNLKTQTEAQISNIVMELRPVNSQANEGEIVMNILTGVASNVHSLVENGNFQQIKKGMEQRAKKKHQSENAKNLYHGVTGGIAILTNVIDPWIEVALVILPDIIDGLKALFGESEYDKVRKNLVSCVYPQITERMHSMVQQCVEESYTALLDHIENEFNEKTAQLTGEMENMKAVRSDETEKYELYVEKLKTDIMALDELISELN